MSNRKISLFGWTILTWDEHSLAQQITQLSEENAILKQKLEDSEADADAAKDAAKQWEDGYSAREQQLELANGQIEVLKSQMEDMLAWRQVELERLKTEAIIFSVKRGQAINPSGESGFVTE